MIDWDDFFHRTPKKEPEEEEFDRLCDEYREIFGEPFGYGFLSSPPIEQAIAEVKECIRTRTKQEHKKSDLPEGAVI